MCLWFDHYRKTSLHSTRDRLLQVRQETIGEFGIKPLSEGKDARLTETVVHSTTFASLLHGDPLRPIGGA